MSFAHWALAAAIAVSAPVVSSATLTTGMKYVSKPGDWIGQGQTETFVPPAATVSATGDASSVHVSVTDASSWWTLDFAAPVNTTLAPGSYPAAARYPFQSPMAPGLSMDGDGRGCNELKGWFRVREYARDVRGAVKKLAIDYVQNCEISGPPLYGAVRVNSNLPLMVPMTAAVAGPDLATLEGRTVLLDGTQTFTRRNVPVSYLWTQTDGPAVTLLDAATATPSFVAPAVPLSGATLRFRLDTTDQKEASSDDVVVIVNSLSAPRTQANFSGNSGDYITLGRSWAYDTHNASISFSRNFSGGINAAINGDAWWNFDTAAAQGKTYKPGVYRHAERFPFQSSTAPGLSLFGDGRGCNTLTGFFKVYQAEFDASGNPTVADISFEQHCEGGTSRSKGEFVLNAVPHATLQRQFAEARKRFPRQ